jgi:hypothetical protein
MTGGSTKLHIEKLTKSASFAKWITKYRPIVGSKQGAVKKAYTVLLPEPEGNVPCLERSKILKWEQLSSFRTMLPTLLATIPSEVYVN